MSHNKEEPSRTLHVTLKKERAIRSLMFIVTKFPADGFIVFWLNFRQ
jgi:hypothetical protein